MDQIKVGSRASRKMSQNGIAKEGISFYEPFDKVSRRCSITSPQIGMEKPFGCLCVRCGGILLLLYTHNQVHVYAPPPQELFLYSPSSTKHRYLRIRYEGSE